ncbi:hypothetical protein CJ030_MR6G020531 [Morella rubra]|uniref:Uncharacterized protein n=1 Tax=Morella rubra TaxID=262757 RepID=A0A6A1VA79_9ROSI|nr:hypothetical protein CJ030_MR6G020531 [Morella rubra]
MQPTHEMVGNISFRLAALELKVVSMDAELKKQVFEVQLALKGVATSAELVALTERVVLLEEHMSDVRRRSAINKENRAKLKIVHTLGARSFQRARALLEKMEALQLQHESEGKSYTEVEIFAEVLGTKAGYVRGLGLFKYGLLDHLHQYSPLICPGGWRRPDYRLRR